MWMKYQHKKKEKFEDVTDEKDLIQKKPFATILNLIKHYFYTFNKALSNFDIYLLRLQ